MFYHFSFSLLAVFSLFIGSIQNAFAFDVFPGAPKFELPDKHLFFRLEREPLIRIGLTTNASSATITTTDAQLVAVSPDEPNKFLAVNRISVSARSYRPPEYLSLIHI